MIYNYSITGFQNTNGFGYSGNGRGGRGGFQQQGYMNDRGGRGGGGGGGRGRDSYNTSNTGGFRQGYSRGNDQGGVTGK